MPFRDWISRDWPYIAPPTGILGLLVHPKVRKWFSIVAMAIAQPGLLVQKTLVVEAEAERSKESAAYWEDSYKELTDRVDDLETRLKRQRIETVAMQNELKEVRRLASRRKDAMARLAQDREAAILHIAILEAHLLQKGEVIPPRPDWQSAGYDVLMPDSLGP